ncbi:hypothetical protein SK128_009358 [Halocaridina rubra]|uniref:C2H2-type domain-containing protein n=1 Tax=Halocaridina rubra TaxID=373956 RepID=A0AAN8ZZH5_HALRR
MTWCCFLLLGTVIEDPIFEPPKTRSTQLKSREGDAQEKRKQEDEEEETDETDLDIGSLSNRSWDMEESYESSTDSSGEVVFLKNSLALAKKGTKDKAVICTKSGSEFSQDPSVKSEASDVSDPFHISSNLEGKRNIRIDGLFQNVDKNTVSQESIESTVGEKQMSLVSSIDKKVSKSSDAHALGIKRKLTSVDIPEHGCKIRKTSLSEPSDNCSCNSQKLTGLHPPVKVRKITPVNDASFIEPTKEFLPDVINTFNKLNKAHSAQCIKQDQTKCDFVCSLYKSKDWAGVSSQQNSACSLCRNLFGWEGLTCVKLNQPLPSSFINPITLLRYYGFEFCIPKNLACKNDPSLVNICQKCYNLVLDGDIAFKRLQSLALEMRHVWPKVAYSKISLPVLQDRTGKNEMEIPNFPQKEKCSEDETNSNPKKPGIKHIPQAFPQSITNLCSAEESTFDKPMQKEEQLKNERNKPLTCGFCGIGICMKDQWERHMGHFHKVHRKWYRFTPQMHNNLRTRIIDELMKSNHKENSGRFGSSQSDTLLCCACDESFNDQVTFLAHLREFHNMTVDDDIVIGKSIIALKSPKSESEVDKKVYLESKMLTDEYKPFESCSTKEQKQRTVCNSKGLIARDISGTSDMDKSNNTANSNEDGLPGKSINPNSKRDICKDLSNEDFNENKTVDSESNNQIDSSHLPCLVCSETFTTVKEIKAHIDNMHLTPTVLKDNGSGGVINYNIDAQTSSQPIKKEIEETNIEECEVKATSFPIYSQENEEDLNSFDFPESNQRREKRDTDADTKTTWYTMNECQICERHLRSKKLLYAHLKKIHDIPVNLLQGEPMYSCKFCLFCSKDQAVLVEHKREKHGYSQNASQTPCEICGRMYASSYVDEHVAVVHGNERKFLCDFCGSKFPHIKSLQSHIYYEHPNRHWKCEECNLIFKKYYQLRKHVLDLHSNEEHLCEICSKAFKRKGDLTNHIKRSHGHISIICKYCSRHYRDRSKYRSHLVHVHGCSKEDTFSHRYARHKRANNRLFKNSEKIEEIVLVKDQEGPVEIDSRTKVNYKNDILKNCDDTVSVPSEPEFQVVEVTETGSDVDADKVALIIFP